MNNKKNRVLLLNFKHTLFLSCSLAANLPCYGMENDDDLNEKEFAALFTPSEVEDPQAQFNEGLREYNTFLEFQVQSNLDHARFWFGRAKANNNPIAQSMLDMLPTEGGGSVALEIPDISDPIKKEAQKQFAEGLKNYCEFLDFRSPLHLTSAKNFFTLAAKNNHKVASALLATLNGVEPDSREEESKLKEKPETDVKDRSSSQDDKISQTNSLSKNDKAAQLTDKDLVQACLKTLFKGNNNLARSAMTGLGRFVFDKNGQIKTNSSFIKIVKNNKGDSIKQSQAITVNHKDPLYVALGIWRAHIEYHAIHSQAQGRRIESILQLVFNQDIGYSNYHFGNLEFASIPMLSSSNPFFTSLDLYNCQVLDITLDPPSYRKLNNADIKPFLNIRHLEKLILKDTNITVDSSFSSHPSLNRLELENSQVNTAGVKFLCSNSKITHLNLRNNPLYIIQQDKKKHKKKSKEEAEVVELTFIQHIASSMPNLTYLDLRNNHLTDDLIIPLTRLKKLITLDLGYNSGISPDSNPFKTLKTTFPQGLKFKIEEKTSDTSRAHVDDKDSKEKPKEEKTKSKK